MALTPYLAPDKIGYPQPLAKEVEHEWFLRLSKGDSHALDVLVRHNMRLVVHIAKRYQGAEDNEEIVSIGSVGLLKAIRCFDAQKGTRFSTFAAKCIENEILMYLRANKHNAQNVSLFQAVGIDKEGNEVTLLDTLYSENDEVGRHIEEAETVQLVYKVMRACLSVREQRIVIQRYGLFGHDKVPQRAIAAAEGISRSYISRLEKKALVKMQQYMLDNGIDDALF